jgi:hypothetical protein
VLKRSREVLLLLIPIPNTQNDNRLALWQNSLKHEKHRRQGDVKLVVRKK